MAFVPIPVFNSRLTFAQAFTRDRDAIHEFLNDVASDPDAYRERDPANPTQPYPDADRQRRIETLRLLRDGIIALTPPNGGKFIAPQPPQLILRTGEQLDPTQNIQWHVNNNAEPFFIIFDLLGAFLSIIGPAPTTNSTAPTAQNYFLPLVVVYAKWCRTLLGDGSGRIPTAAQVTWARQNNTNPYFFYLGTSAKGWVPSWRVRAQQERHKYMFRLLESKYRVWGVSPEFEAPERGGRGGWNFGNCAETYPFLYLISDGFPAANISGISLNIADTATLGVDWSQYWANGPIKPPCRNCSYLITRFQALVANFILYQP